jgi:hypothetical protein
MNYPLIRSLIVIVSLVVMTTACDDFQQAPSSTSDTVAKKDTRPSPNSTDKRNFGARVLSFIPKERTRFDNTRVRDSVFVYTATYKGRISRIEKGAAEDFLFDLKAKYLVDVLHILPLQQGFWIACWQETGSEGISSRVALFRTGKPEPEWKHVFPAPDIGLPLQNNDQLYVTARGLTACIRISSGQISWKLDKLYNPYTLAWQKLQMPALVNGKLRLTDYPAVGRRERIDTLWLNPLTGETIR